MPGGSFKPAILKLSVWLTAGQSGHHDSLDDTVRYFRACFARTIWQRGLELLGKYGEVSIVGSYGMNIMTWNDLDFYIDKSSLNTANYYGLASEILEKFVPGHFDGAFHMEKESAFLGFETSISGDRWNVDIWWKSQTEINDSIAYANDIARLTGENPTLKNAVITIKQDLISRRLYGFDKGKKHYHSKEIYDAVFHEGILTTEQFLTKLK